MRLYPDGTKAFIAVHVDDFGVATSTVAMMDSLVAQIQAIYQTTESDMNYYLGMLITRDRTNRTLTISQPGYIDELIDNFTVNTHIRPQTPMIDKSRLPESVSNQLLPPSGQQLYQSKVGCALWAAIGTRPDILHATNLHTRYTKAPRTGDMETLDYLLQYLVAHPDLGITLGGIGGVVLWATVDVSYVSHEDRKSHTGCTLHLGKGSGAFLSRSKKQTVTADSSTVAEFIGTHLVTKEIMWARSLLGEMGYPQIAPTILYENN